MNNNQRSIQPQDYFDRFREIIKEIIKYDYDFEQLFQMIDRNVPFRKLQKDFYRGETDGNSRKGKGEWISEDGSLYKLGFWQNNCLQGRGLTLYCPHSTHTYYECFYGNYDKGKPNGYGKLKIKKKQQEGEQMYEGQWENGQMNGEGSINIQNSYRCKGQFKNNKLCGKGEIESANQLEIWKMNGTFIDSDTFKGEIKYKEGKYFGQAKYHENQWKMHGQGKFIWNDQSFYNGGFIYNKRNGYGVSQFLGEKTSEEYIWKDDQKHKKVEHN